MPMLDALHAELALRGLVAGILLFHALNLALPGPRAPARWALVGFVLSVLAYLFCQQPEVMLVVPRPFAYGLLLGCVAGTAWMWVAARALFDDRFRWSMPVMAALSTIGALGLAANLPYFPDADGPFRTFPSDSPVAWLGRLHALGLLAFATLALWEVARGWNDDLVESRRSARRWVAMFIGLYAGMALVIELALKGQNVGRLLPALHAAGIGTIALALALWVARRPLAEALGFAAPQALATSPPSSGQQRPACSWLRPLRPKTNLAADTRICNGR
jgi:hypothetical protein